MEDKDANCRLRHGLNVHCLSLIFQYLDTRDLYTVGELNEFYKQIIADSVISKHEVNFSKLYKNGVTVLPVFQRYGTKIRKFHFSEFHYENQLTIYQFIEAITQYCAADQLKSVSLILIRDYDSEDLPIQFRNVEKFVIQSDYKLSIQFPESLRYLTIVNMEFNPNFDWTNLKNLISLDLSGVDDINAHKFMELLQYRPKLKLFHHSMDTFGEFTQDVCDTVAKYCGDQIVNYSGEMPFYYDVHHDLPERGLFKFLSAFKNVKSIDLTTYQLCGGDIIEALQRLAENDSIESLKVSYQYEGYDNANCIFRNIVGADVGQFSHLKTIEISDDDHWDCGKSKHDKLCQPFEFLMLYSQQLMSNVENLHINFLVYSWDFIKFAQKLRQLYLREFYLNQKFCLNHAAEILSILNDILKMRQNGHNREDFIEITFDQRFSHDQDAFTFFDEINGDNDSIKLSLREDSL